MAKGKSASKAGQKAKPLTGKARGALAKATRKKSEMQDVVQQLGGKSLGWVPIDQVRPHPKNVRKHPQTQIDVIKESMSAFGFGPAIIVDEAMVVLIGHGRLEAARQLGLETVRVDQIDYLNPAQKRGLMAVDNHSFTLGADDVEGLADALKAMRDGTGADDGGLDLGKFGFTADGLAAIFKSGGFLDDLLPTGSDEHDGNDGVRVGAGGVSLKFDMLPADRDVVVTWLGQQREKLKVRTSAEALVKLARAGLKGGK